MALVSQQWTCLLAGSALQGTLADAIPPPPAEAGVEDSTHARGQGPGGQGLPRSE